jgi:hypothetical protein
VFCGSQNTGRVSAKQHKAKTTSVFVAHKTQEKPPPPCFVAHKTQEEGTQNMGKVSAMQHKVKITSVFCGSQNIGKNLHLRVLWLTKQRKGFGYAT